MNLMDTDKIQRIQAAVEIVDLSAKRAAEEAEGDRGQAYRLLNHWARSDAVLEDALNWVGLLITMKEELEGQGEMQRAASIENLLHARTDDFHLLKESPS